MECIETSELLREWAGGSAMPEEARAHLSRCEDCSNLWRQERELTAALAGLRAQTREASASLAVKAAVVEAFPSKPRANRPAWRPLLALAAALIMAIAGGWFFTRPKPAVHQASQPVYTDFFPLSTVALDRHEPAQLVRIRLPRREMRKFGLPVSEEFERTSIEADVLIGQDGIARAVRFVSLSQ